MNYTLNRPLLMVRRRLDTEISGCAADQRLRKLASCLVGTAKRAEAEKRWIDAASYYHGAEFYLPAGEVRNGLLRAQLGSWNEECRGLRTHRVPYPGGHLPGFRLQAKGKELSTFIFHGGYDSFVEEFYGFLLPLTELGFGD
jgi:hypothetical protein